MSSLAVRNNCPTSKDRNWTLRYTPVHYDKTPAETLYRKIVTEQQNFDENSPSTNINSKISNHLVDTLNKLHAVGVALNSLNAPATADEQGKSFSTSSQSRHGKNIPALVAANDRSINGSSLLVAVDFCDPRAYVPPAHVKIFFDVVKQLPVCSFPIRKLSFELSDGSLELAKMLWDLLFSSDVSNNNNNSNHHGDDDENKKQKRQQYFTLLREISVDSRSDILGAGPFFLKFLRTFPRIVSFSLYDAKRTRLFQGDVEASFLEACETQAEVNASRNSSLAEEYEKSAVGNIAATKKQNNSPTRDHNDNNSLGKDADVSDDVQQKQQLQQQKQNSIATTFCGGVPSSWSRRFANRLPEDRLADEIRKNILEANIKDSDDEQKRLSRQEKNIINSFLFCRRGIPLLEIDPSAGVFDNEAAAIRAFEKVASEHRTGKFNDPSFTSEIMMKVKKNSQPQEEDETIFHRCFDPNPPSNIVGYDNVNSNNNNNNNNSNSNDNSKKQYFFSPHHRYSKALIPVEDESLNTPPKYFCPPPPPPLPIDNGINSENNIDDDADDGNDDQNKFDGVVVAPTITSSRATTTSGAVVLFASPVGLPVALRRGSDDILRGEMHVALPKRLTTMVIDETTASDQRTSEQLRNDLTDQRVSKTMMIPVGTNQKHQQQQQTRSGMNNKSLVLFPTPPLANSSLSHHNSKGIFTSPTKMMLPVSSAPVFSDPHQNLFGPDASIESGKLVADRYLAQAVSAAVSHDASGVFSSIFIRAEPRAGVVLVALQCPVRGKKVYILIDDRVPLLSVSSVPIPSNASPTSTTQRSTLTITKQLCLLRQSRNIVKNLANNSVAVQQLHTQQQQQQQQRQKSLSQANSSQSEPVSPGLLVPSANALVPVFATSLGRSVDLPSAMKVNYNNNNNNNNTTMRTTNQSSVTDESVTAYYKNMSVTAAAFITSTNIGAVPFALTTSTTDINHYGLRNNINFNNNNNKETQQSQQFSTRGTATAATFKNENNFANSIFHTNHSARVFFESVRTCPWIPLLEKALAKLFGSYDNLSTGTFQTALEILLGGSAAEFAFPDFSAFSATKVSLIEQDLNKKRGVDKFLNYGYPDFNHPHSLQSSNGKKKSDDIVEEGFVYFGQHLFHPNAIRTSVAKNSLILARCEAETPEAARSLAERGLAPEELFLVEKTFDIDDEELQGGKFAVAAKKKLSKRELLLLKRKQQAMHDSVYRYNDDDLLAMDDDESDDDEDDEAGEEDAHVIEEKKHLDEEAALKKKLDAEEESIINSHHHVPHQHYRLFRLRSIERQINNFAAAATASVHPSTKPWSAAHTFSSSSDYQQHNLSLGPLTIQSPRPPPPPNASQQQQQHFFFNNNNIGVGLRNTLFSQGTALYNKWAVRLGCVPLAMDTHHNNNNNNHNMKKNGISNVSDDTQRSQFSNNNAATNNNNNNNNFVVTVNGALPPSAVTVSQPLTRGPGSFRAGVLSPQVATATATVNAFVPVKQMATRKQPVAVIASIEQIETNEEEDDSDDGDDDDEDEDDESYSSEATTSIANSQTSISLKNNSTSISNLIKHNSNASYLNSTNPPTPNNKLHHRSDIMRKLSIASESGNDNVSSQHLVPVPPPPSFSFVPMMATNNAASAQPSTAVRPLPQPKKLNVSYSSSTENNRSTTFFSESLPSGRHSPARDQQQQQQNGKKVSPDNSSDNNNNSQARQLRKSPDNNSNNQKFVNNNKNNNNNNSATSAIVTSPDCFLITAEDFFVTFRAAIVLSFLHQSPTIDVHRETIPIKISLSRKKLASLLQTMMMTMNANNNQEETLLLHQQSLRSSSIPSSLLSLRRESYRSWLEFAPAFIVRNVAGKHSIRIVAGIADHVKFFSQHRQQQQQQNRKNKDSMVGLQISVLELRQDAVNSTENAVSNFLSSRHTQQTLREIIVPRQFCWDAQKDLLFETPVVFSGSVSLDMKLTPRAATSNTCLYVVISACSVDQNDSSDDEEVENKNNKTSNGNPSQVEEADLFVQCWLDGGSAEEVFIQRVNDRIHVVTSLPDTIDATLAPCVEVDDFISKTARNLSQQQVLVNNNNHNNNVHAPLRKAGSGRNCFVEEISPSVPSGTPTASARPPVSPANSNSNNNNSKMYLDDQQNHQQLERRSRGSSLHSADGSGTVEAGNNNNNNNNTNNSHNSSAKEFSPATSVFGEDDQNKFHHHRPQSRQNNENGGQDQPQIKRISFSQTTPIELASTAITRPTESKNTNCNADDEGDNSKTFRQKKAELFQSLVLPSSSASSLLTTQHKLFHKRSQIWTLADFPQFLVRFSHLPIPPKVVVPLPRSRRASSNVSRRGSHVPNNMMMMMMMTNSPSGGSILGSPPYASSMQGGSPNATSGIVPARSPTSRIFGASSLFAFATQGNNNYHNDALQSDGEHVLSHQTANSVHNDVGVTILVEAPHLRGVSLFNRTKMGFAVFQLEDETTSPTQQKRQENITKRFQNFDELALACSSTRWSTAAATNSNITSSGTTSVGENCVFTTTKEGSGVPCIFHAHTVGPSIAIRLPVAPPPIVLHQQNFAQSTANASNLPPQHNPFLQQQNSNNNYNNYQNNVSRKTSLLPGAGDSLSEPPSSCSNQGSRRPSSLVPQKQPSSGNYNTSNNVETENNNNNNNIINGATVTPPNVVLPLKSVVVTPSMMAATPLPAANVVHQIHPTSNQFVSRTFLIIPSFLGETMDGYSDEVFLMNSNKNNPGQRSKKENDAMNCFKEIFTTVYARNAVNVSVIPLSK